MRIMPVTVQKFNKPVFRSMACDYKLNGMEMGLYTWMFRGDMDWQKLARFELENFKDKEKVNIIQFAPSDGTEGYTKILSLLMQDSKVTEKFFPIQAYDINESIVKGAKTGYLNLNTDDMGRLIKNGVNVDQYFPGALEYYIDNKENKSAISQTFNVSEELTKRIQFNHGDMFKLLPLIQDDSNTIVMVRNCLGYYPKKIVEDFIHTASKVLKEGSLVIVGQLEFSSFFDALFNQHGFFPVINNVFRKGAR